MALTPSEVRLARWLHRVLGFGGARTFVARRGAPMIMAGLHDGLMVVACDPGPLDGVAVARWRAAGRKGPLPPALAMRRRRVNPQIDKPPAFLRWLVDQLVVEAR